MVKKGLIIINTGNGKGKTTAALGVAFRALGHGFNVCMVQFIKGSWKYGELEAAKKFDNFTLLPMGKGFVNLGAKEPDKEDVKLAKETLEKGKEAIFSEKYKIVILDEINYALTYKLIHVKQVLEILTDKPNNVHVILTGRGADKFPELINVADLVTEMREIKHPYHRGITAQRGIEF
jgi:cob(I)alamin adenosyltransferase